MNVIYKNILSAFNLHISLCLCSVAVAGPSLNPLSTAPASSPSAILSAMPSSTLLPLDFEPPLPNPRVITTPVHHNQILMYTIRNNTQQNLPLEIILKPDSLAGVPFFKVDIGSCGPSLAAQQTCQLAVEFIAPINPESLSAQLSIYYQGRAPLVSMIQAQAVNVPSLVFVQEPFTPVILRVDQTRTIIYTLQNTASTTITNIQPTVLPLPELSINPDPQVTTCGSTLLPGQSCNIGVRIQATSHPQNTKALLSIKYDQSNTALTSNFAFSVVSTAPLALGYNLSGYEFSTQATPSLYPTATDASDFVTTVKANAIRLPFRMEYFADQNGNLNNASYLASLNSYALSLLQLNPDLQILLDLHNYMRYCPNQQAGSCQTFLTPSQVATVWQTIVNNMSIVKQYPNNIILDLMNEPNGITATDTFNDEMAAFLPLRQNGVTNMVVLEGTAWTGLHSWESSGNSAVFTPSNISNYFVTHGGTADQVGSDAIEVHQYLDPNFSGTTATCIDSANLLSSMNFNDFVTWLQSNPIPVILGETGGGNNQPCIDDLQLLYQSTLNYPYGTSGGFVSFLYWGAGQAWGNSYLFGIEPISSLNTPGYLATYASSQLFLSMEQIGSSANLPALYTTIPPTQYNYGACNSALLSINLKNALNLYQSTGNLQYAYNGSGPQNAPMSFPIPNDPWQYQEETLCLPTSSTTVYGYYPAPQYPQVPCTPITSTPTTQAFEFQSSACVKTS